MEKQESPKRIILLIVASFVTLIASFYFDLLVTAIAGSWAYITEVKAGLLAISALILLFVEKGDKPVMRYATVLFSVSLSTLLNEYLQTLPWVNRWTASTTFLGNIGGNVLLKLLSAVIIVLFLLALFPKPKDAYLVPGDLKVKAEPIRFLGISKNWVSWGRLALVSGGLIAAVTVGLAIITVTGTGTSPDFSLLLKVLPFLFILAPVNSFCEGIMCRNAVVGPLGRTFPKEAVMILSAVYFGSFHYYGAPGGIVGVVMSSILGWFMARSLFETKGFLAPWIIHAMQDFVIFMTLALLGGYTF